MKELIRALWALQKELQKLNEAIPLIKGEMSKTETIQRLRAEDQELRELLRKEINAGN